MKNKLTIGLALPAILIGFAAPAAAQNWTGATDTNWFDAGNWGTGLPGAGDDVHIDTTTPNTTVVNAAPTAVLEYVYVGLLGSGDLTIADGGAVSNTYGYLGLFTGSIGTVLVTGAGSSWTNSFDLYVGYQGSGDLTIADGGAVSNSNGTLGNFAGSTGTVLVTGAGSSWTNGLELYVGGYGAGDLTVSDGGVVSNRFGLVGYSGSGTGTVLVTGAGSTWTNTGDLYVGFDSAGDLTVEAGATVISELSGIIGLYSNSSGTAIVTGAGSSWSTINYDLTVGWDGDGALTVSNGGAVSAINVEIGRFVGSTGLITIGGVGAAAAPGVVDAPTVTFGDGDADMVFNHTSSNYTFAAAFVGGSAGGLISFDAGTTNLTGNSSSYVGDAAINGGSVYFNNLFGGDVSVASGGLIGGTGSVANLNVASGAIVAPGNSIGTLSAGSASFAAGSIYRVEVNAAGQSDLLNVTGAVTISGGTVQVLAANGLYAPSTQYTIIQGGSVTGTFDGVSSNLAFLDPTLGYDAGQVYLTMTRNDTDFSAVAATPNQTGTASAIEELGFGNPIWNAVVGQSEGSAQAAFDALSGEFHAGLDGGGFSDPLAMFSIVQSRLSGTAEGPRALQLASIGSTDGMAPNAERGSVWGQIFAAHGDVSEDGNAAGLDYTQSGLIVGADGRVGESGRLGAALSYQRTQASQDARRSDGDVSSYGVSVYGGTQAGAFLLSGEAGYSQREIDTTRRVTVGMIDETLNADYQAQAMHVQARVGYPIATANGAIEPFLSLAYVSVDTDGFTENGGSAALTRGDQSDSVTFATLGVRVMQEFGPNGRDGGLFGSLGLRHAEGDILPRSEMAFASNPGVSFSVDGAPIAENALALEGGIRWQLGENSSLTASYRGDIADDAQSHGASVRLTMAY